VRIGLSDAQTSGGLLVSVAPASVDGFCRDLRAHGVLAAIVGTVRPGAGIEVY
jgi:selenophosphate synthase